MISVSAIAFGQDPAAPRNSVITGEIATLDAGKAVLKTANGDVTITLTDKTEYKRVPPENPSLKAAVDATLADIGVGDKLMVTGMKAADGSIPAKSVYLMTKSDIARRETEEKQKWATRGISGRVTAVNADTRQITVEVRGLGAATSVVLTPKETVKVLRYAPNSIRYDQAVASKVSEIAVGDMLRAVGDRSADGASFAAEEIVTGSFQTIAGTVKTIDAEKNEVVITDLASKKDVTVSLGSATTMKKFPEQMAQMLAARQGGGPAGPGGGMGGPGRPGAGGPQRAGGEGQPMRGGTGQGGPGGMGNGGPGGAGRGGIDDMLERFPNITAADLKPGEMIAISSTKTAALDRVTAIKLLAGVEPFIRVAQMQAAAQGGRGQGSPSLNIPGLDGFDN
jgi:hypothetical protein